MTRRKKIHLHILVLFSAAAVSYFWSIKPELNIYSLQLTGALMLFLILSRRILNLDSFRLAESTISTMAILLLVSATGGISSPLFFLNYFLLFEMSLLLEPLIPLVLGGTLVGFYILTNEISLNAAAYEMLLALPFMTPVAYIFGRLYLKEENQKKEIKGLERKIRELKDELAAAELERN